MLYFSSTARFFAKTFSDAAFLASASRRARSSSETGEDLHRQKRGVFRTVDGHGRHGYARGHLHGGQKRVQPVERRGLYGNPDDGKGGVRRDAAREVRGLPAAAMIAPNPFSFAFAANKRASSGVLCAEYTCISNGTPKFFSVFCRLFEYGQSLSLP